MELDQEESLSIKKLERQVEDRFIGTVLGLAVGDALGAPVEFWPAEIIAEKYGTLREMVGGGQFQWLPGEYTDDTSMMLCIAESLVAMKRYSPEDIAWRFVEWYDSDPKDIGRTTKKALSRLSQTFAFRESGIKQGRANGSIMRCAPLSLMFPHEENKLFSASAEVSAMTHAHEDAKLSCIFLNLMIARLVLGADKKSAYFYTLNRIKDKDPDFIHNYVENSYKADPAKGLAVNTLLLATSTFMRTSSFEEAVVKAISFGGDTDTTAAVTGALAGAHYGRSSIPRRWSSMLKPKRAKHFVKIGQALFRMEKEL